MWWKGVEEGLRWTTAFLGIFLVVYYFSTQNFLVLAAFFLISREKENFKK